MSGGIDTPITARIKTVRPSLLYHMTVLTHSHPQSKSGLGSNQPWA
jgi:hypothetical protein